MTNLVTVLLDAAPLLATGLIADGALWRTARDDHDAVIEDLNATDAQMDETASVKAVIADRIAATPATSFAECAPKLAVLRDCYCNLVDMAEDVAGRSDGYSPLARTMALSVCRDLLALTEAVA